MATRRTSYKKSSRKRTRVRAETAGIGLVEKGFYVAAVTFTLTITTLLAHGAALFPDRSPAPIPIRAIASRNTVYERALVLAARYDSRPYWHESKLTVGAPTTRAMADLAIEHLIPCESGGRTIHHLDSNGKMSYGILQFQDWEEWERVSGIHGDPDNSDDAIRMAEWGVEHGMIDHWGCARILGEY